MTNYNSQPTPNRKCVKHAQVAAHAAWSIYQLAYTFGNSWFSTALTLDILSLLLHTSACLIAIVDVYRVFVICRALFKVLHSFNLDSNPQRTFNPLNIWRVDYSKRMSCMYSQRFSLFLASDFLILSRRSPWFCNESILSYLSARIMSYMHLYPHYLACGEWSVNICWMSDWLNEC